MNWNLCLHEKVTRLKSVKRRPESAEIHTPKDSAQCNALTSALRCAEVNKL